MDGSTVSEFVYVKITQTRKGQRSIYQTNIWCPHLNKTIVREYRGGA